MCVCVCVCNVLLLSLTQCQNKTTCCSWMMSFSIFTSQEGEHVRVELLVVPQPNLTKLWLLAATSDIWGQGRRNDKVLNRERIRLG